MIRKLAGIFLTLIQCSLWAEEKAPLVIDNKFEVREGKKYVGYYLSTDTVMSPVERYVDMRSGVAPSVKRYLFVTTQSEKWLYFRVINQQTKPFDLLIEMGNFGLKGADYYVFHRDAIIDSGSVRKRWGLHTSEIYDRNIIIPYSLDCDKEYSFLIKVYTNAPLFDLPVIFWKKTSKIDRSQAIELGRGLFYGVLAFFILVTGIVVYLIRERSYFYYWLYLGIGAMLLFMKSGIPLEILWPGRSYFDFIVLNFFLYAYMIITLVFMREYLTERLGVGWYLTAIRIFLVIGSLLMILYIPGSLVTHEWQDILSIIQTVYVNITNVLVVVIIFWAIPKIQEKGPLILALIYYLIFSTYLFNPFIELGFLTGRPIGHILIYIGGISVGFVLVTLTALRIKVVFERNQQVRQQLSNLNKSYSFSLIQGQEKERKRVAEELHDGIGAHLSSIKMRFSALKSQIEPEFSNYFDSISDNMDESCRQVRELSHELMPPALKRFGLDAATKDIIKHYQITYPASIEFRANIQQVQLDETSQVTIYRLLVLILEWLVHSQSQEIKIRLVISPSVEKATIRIQHSGSNLSKEQNDDLAALRSMVDLLQGRFDTFMSNIWDDEIMIEIPVTVVN
jgi:signal transduction histidine kinase